MHTEVKFGLGMYFSARVLAWHVQGMGFDLQYHQIKKKSQVLQMDDVKINAENCKGTTMLEKLEY
jgi:hypothetical protein